MFDKERHNEDLWMKAILENGQEEVPAHIWDGVSSGLDRIARRKKTIVFWRRAAIGMSAAAALAFGVFFGHRSQEQPENMVAETTILVPDNAEEISVVTEKTDNETLVAMASVQHVPVRQIVFPETGIRSDITETQVEPETRPDSESPAVTDDRTQSESSAPAEISVPAKTSGNDDWVEEPEERRHARKTKASLMLSGIAGTNSAQNNNIRTRAIRRPTLSDAPVKTSVKQTEPGDFYGIPLSFGIGTKIDFTERWAVGVGVNYTFLSRKFYGDYTKVVDGQISEIIKGDIRNTQHYIGIPVNVYYNIVQKSFINFYAYAGGTVEKSVSNEYRIASRNIVHKEAVQGVQLSADLGIGVEFMLGKHLGLYIDPSARYYFNCGQPKSIRTAQPFMLGFEIGFRTRL